MDSKIVFSVFCFVVSTAVYESESMYIGDQTSQFFNFTTALHRYKKYIHSPTPSKIVVHTRDLIEENVREVQPAGIILHKCPTFLAAMNDWPCNSTESVEVTVEVRIKKGHTWSWQNISTTEDVSCTCGV